MTMDITKSVAFTGHRSERILQVGMLHLYLDIVSQVRRLYSLGYRYFLSGMAEGFDLLAAQAVTALKAEYTFDSLPLCRSAGSQTDTGRRTSPYTTG